MDLTLIVCFDLLRDLEGDCGLFSIVLIAWFIMFSVDLDDVLCEGSCGLFSYTII